MTTEAVTIDLLLPFYGDPGHFREAVESVRGQSDPAWRLVVLDDCYPHWDPAPWLAELDDPRIVFLRNPTNLGVNGSFARCAELAEADYATILGGDDRLLPNYVATVRSLIDRFDRPDYVQPGVRVIDGAGAEVLPLVDRVKSWVRPRLPRPRVLAGQPVVHSLMRGDWTYFPAICWRSERLKRHGFDPRYEIVLDSALKVGILLDRGRFAVTPEVAFEYRRHEGSASSFSATDGSRFAEEQQLSREFAEALDALGWRRTARLARLRPTSRLNALTKAPGALASGRGGALRALLRHAFSR